MAKFYFGGFNVIKFRTVRSFGQSATANQICKTICLCVIRFDGVSGAAQIRLDDTPA